MRKAILLAGLLVAALPSSAAEEKKEPAKEGGKEAVKGGAPGTNTDRLLLIAPLNDENGKLTAYAYINFRLTMMSDTYALGVREKIPFLQDAFVRDVNGASIAAAGDDPRRVNVAGVEARLLADARKIVGAGKLKQIIVCTVEISDLRPAQPLSGKAPGELPVVDEHGNPQKSRCES